MAEWIFDKNGDTSAIFDSDCIRTNLGDVVAWIFQGNIYSLEGNHVGWFENGVFFDSSNAVIGFLWNATGVPSRPSLSGTPGMPGFSGRPGKPGFSGAPGKPGRGNSWSRVGLIEYLTA